MERRATATAAAAAAAAEAAWPRPGRRPTATAAWPSFDRWTAARARSGLGMSQYGGKPR